MHYETEREPDSSFHAGCYSINNRPHRKGS